MDFHSSITAGVRCKSIPAANISIKVSNLLTYHCLFFFESSLLVASSEPPPSTASQLQLPTRFLQLPYILLALGPHLIFSILGLDGGIWGGISVWGGKEEWKYSVWGTDSLVDIPPVVQLSDPYLIKAGLTSTFDKGQAAQLSCSYLTLYWASQALCCREWELPSKGLDGNERFEVLRNLFYFSKGLDPCFLEEATTIEAGDHRLALIYILEVPGKSLHEFKAPEDYEDYKSQSRCPTVCYSKHDLYKLVDKQKKVKINSYKALLNYQLCFIDIAAQLQISNQLSWIKKDNLFLKGLNQEFQGKILQRLKWNDQRQYADDPWPTFQVACEAERLLKEEYCFKSSKLSKAPREGSRSQVIKVDGIKNPSVKPQEAQDELRVDNAAAVKIHAGLSYKSKNYLFEGYEILEGKVIWSAISSIQGCEAGDQAKAKPRAPLALGTRPELYPSKCMKVFKESKEHKTPSRHVCLLQRVLLVFLEDTLWSGELLLRPLLQSGNPALSHWTLTLIQGLMFSCFCEPKASIYEYLGHQERAKRWQSEAPP
ncbi:hypothetical protein EDD16DRAFT_1521954 [Pisolithus croceorrhizus]|nr:hypothetical protein EDD16DRAFT_1521954 [Pisolithus croceorrhizus]KAI6119285.1 hypothetical protein EV401DRAFT_1888275 [Pisolithus croceorrhizus]KAI6165134.1 hypothetical protein EDD17DRAFT_1506009 [Pisolithus thermaeus]